MAELGPWDVVYSWGVLHHTGDLWRSFELIQRNVAPGGQLFISIGNDQGARSRIWTKIKHLYNRLPRPARPPFVVAVMLPGELVSAAYATLTLRPGSYVRTWTSYGGNRGMSRWHDMVDWVGGYPYECAKPDAIFSFFRDRGFSLDRLKIGGGLGCSEYVFRRTGTARGA